MYISPPPQQPFDPEYCGEDELTDAELGIAADTQAANLEKLVQVALNPPPAPEPEPDPEPVPCRVAPGEVGDLLRAARWLAEFSQRDLAAAAELPLSTVARLESGAVGDPRVSTLHRLATACGLRLVAVDADGEVVSLPYAQGHFRAHDGRRLPAHLHNRPPDAYWWNYDSLASNPFGPNPPERCYHQRRRTPPPPEPWLRPGA